MCNAIRSGQKLCTVVISGSEQPSSNFLMSIDFKSDSQSLWTCHTTHSLKNYENTFHIPSVRNNFHSKRFFLQNTVLWKRFPKRMLPDLYNINLFRSSLLTVIILSAPYKPPLNMSLLYGETYVKLAILKYPLVY